MLRAEFSALYERYASDVHRFAFWLSGNATDAEDLTAETFARAWVIRDRIMVKTVKAYLLTITRNTHLKWRRRSALRLEITDRTTVAGSGEDLLLQHEALSVVWQELRRLSEEFDVQTSYFH